MFQKATPLLTCAVLMLACGPRARGSEPLPAGEPVEQAAAQPAAAPMSDRKAFGTWAITSLRDAGYKCSEDSPTFQCMAADDTWVIDVTLRMETDVWYVMFDSYVPRAAESQCALYRPKMQALRSDPNFFTVDCNDSSQRFRMSTALKYHTELQLPAWLEGHRRSRFDAWNALNGS
jgi:hypothetical protein